MNLVRLFAPLSRRAALGSVVAASALAVVGVAAPAASAKSCPKVNGAPVFSAFGDVNQYALLPGGDFESTLPGWNLAGSSIASGNDAYSIGAGGSQSLRVANGLQTATICIAPTDPLVRFAVRSVRTPGSSGNYSNMTVTAILSNASGSVDMHYLGNLNGRDYASWKISPQLIWGGASTDWLFAADGTATLKLQFNLGGQGGTWYIDDVYIDPFAGR